MKKSEIFSDGIRTRSRVGVCSWFCAPAFHRACRFGICPFKCGIHAVQPAFHIRSLSDAMPGRPSRSTLWAEKACVPSEHRLFCTPAKQGSTSGGHRLHRNPEYKGLLRVRAVVPQQLPEPVVISPTPGQIDGCRHRRPGLGLRILVHRHIELSRSPGRRPPPPCGPR